MAGTEKVLFAVDVARRLQDVEGVCDRVALAAEGCTDLRGGGRAPRDGREDVVVQGVLGDAGILTEQVLGFRARVNRPAGVEEGVGNPRVESVVGAGGAGEESVAGGTSENRVDVQRGERVFDLPEVSAGAVVEGAEA